MRISTLNKQIINWNGFIVTLYTDQPLRQGLGDWLAGVLNRFGIHGWKGCQCAKRRQWLNNIGWKWQQKFSAFKH